MRLQATLKFVGPTDFLCASRYSILHAMLHHRSGLVAAAGTIAIVWLLTEYSANEVSKARFYALYCSAPPGEMFMLTGSGPAHTEQGRTKTPFLPVSAE